jgi:hypothetical protein
VPSLLSLHELLLGNVPADVLRGYAERFLLLGHAFWIVTYALIGARMYRDGLLGIPLAALFLNITWEGTIYVNCPGIAAELCRPYLSGEWALALALMLTLDAILLAQAFAIAGGRYGRVVTTAFFAVALYVCFHLHVTFIASANDYRGVVDSWLSNAIMSGAFVWLARRRAYGEGLSLPAAYTKLIGSFLVAGGLFAFPQANGLITEERAMTVAALASIVAILDVWYIVLLTRKSVRRTASAIVDGTRDAVSTAARP